MYHATPLLDTRLHPMCTVCVCVHLSLLVQCSSYGRAKERERERYRETTFLSPSSTSVYHPRSVYIQVGSASVAPMRASIDASRSVSSSVRDEARSEAQREKGPPDPQHEHPVELPVIRHEGELLDRLLLGLDFLW